mmetsp:Transcript_46594/g.101477  ORF Transcript_46594/g.101477 Transcript_46594/m.101477 type:complete len:286 (-) Transcript_46594:6-863(-)
MSQRMASAYCGGRFMRLPRQWPSNCGNRLSMFCTASAEGGGQSSRGTKRFFGSKAPGSPGVGGGGGGDVKPGGTAPLGGGGTSDVFATWLLSSTRGFGTRPKAWINSGPIPKGKPSGSAGSRMAFSNTFSACPNFRAALSADVRCTAMPCWSVTCALTACKPEPASCASAASSSTVKLRRLNSSSRGLRRLEPKRSTRSPCTTPSLPRSAKRKANFGPLLAATWVAPASPEAELFLFFLSFLARWALSLLFFFDFLLFFSAGLSLLPIPRISSHRSRTAKTSPQK